MDAEQLISEEFIEEFMNLFADEKHVNQQNVMLHPINFEQLLDSEELFQDVPVKVNKTCGEVLVMALKYALRNKLALTSTSDLFKLINLMFEQPFLFESRYYIDKIFNPTTHCDFHAICPSCKVYVGKLGTMDAAVTCLKCSELMNLSSPSCLNFFMIIDPSEAIADILKEHENYYHYVINERKHVKNHFRDIYDGRKYRKFVDNLPPHYEYITFNFNTDGAPKFKSSKYSIWPIYLMINEIPIQERMNNLITCGMWFGKSKPEMTSFLKPFSEKMKELSTTGINCTLKDKQCNIKAFPLVAVVDSVARAPMQGIKQFNGKYGCNWCLHTGGGKKYPLCKEPPERRNHQKHLEYLKQVCSEDTDDIFGVMYGTPLLLLESFDIIDGFVVDYLHCYLAGVGKQIAQELISLIPNILEADKILKNIKVPVHIGRLPKSLSELGDWKAREWENFILYYSIPLFEALLPDKNLVQYWSLLTISLHVLLKEDISTKELNDVNSKLLNFCIKTQKDFSDDAMTYNIHQLLHIVESVKNWGPLWTHSTFSFEAWNHELLQAIHCAKGVNQQIVRYINIQRYTKKLEKRVFVNCSPHVKNFCENLDKLRVKKSQKLTSITYMGLEEKVFRKLIECTDYPLDGCVGFSRIIKDGCLYTSHSVLNNRTDNSYAQLKNGIFIIIEQFIVDRTENREIVAYRELDTINDDSSIIHKIRSVSQNFMIDYTHEIDKICVFVPTDFDNYIFRVPNLLHY